MLPVYLMFVCFTMTGILCNGVGSMLIMMFRTNVLKEVILPNIDNTDYRLLVDKKSFEVYHSFYLKFEVINRKWQIKSDLKAYQLIHHKQTMDTVEINGGEIVTIKTVDNDIIKCITFNDEISLMPYEKYDIIRCQKLTVGKAEECTIRFEFMNLVSLHHCSIERERNSHILYNTSKNGVFVNCRRIGAHYRLQYGDIIDLFGLRIVYFRDMIAISSRVGSYTVSPDLRPYEIYISDDTRIIPKHRERYFNRAPRIIPSICTEQIVIEPPTNPQFSKKKSLLLTIGPSFTMAIPMLLGCGMMILGSVFSGGMTSAFMFTGLITACGSAVLGSVWALMNIRNTKLTEIADETQRFNAYGNYLRDIAAYIREKYRQNYDALYQLYPSLSECCQYNETSPTLWNRNISHDDFFYYRLGTGDMDFQVNIQIPKEKFSLQFDNLKDKPALIYENFRVLKNVPVGLDFSEYNVYGIVGGEKKRGAFDIVNNIIVRIATSASYADVKIAFCFEAQKFDASKWSYIKWLPHLWSENKKTRYFATDKQEAADVFFELSNIIRQRAESNVGGYQKKTRFRPHYFLFVSDASLLDGEMIAKYVYNKSAGYGLTTFIIADYYQKLPNVCESIIQNDETFCGCYNALNSNQMSVSVKYDKVSEAELEDFAKRLASINVRENEDDTSIVSSLDFFEMYGVSDPSEFHIAERWRKNRTYNSMRALVGKKAGGADCYLDIHEKYHGPHGLVAGTTGSGKSELVQTYILSLAVNYSPDDVSFFVIDFKGGGMANLFEGLPHLVGTISNLSGNQISRAMISIKSENLRRQKLFGEYGVNNINNYTRLYKSGEASQPIPHLLIIIDEFAELKKEQPEFMQELISVAQVGRSLGVHLILATQKPSGTVDENIWSNSKFRLCLRVQDRQDSNDMLHKPDAAYITQAGRCYLQVGNDEIYELFQSGWSGASYDSLNEGKDGTIATMITTTGKEALVGSHTKIKRRERERFLWLSFLYRHAEFLREGITDPKVLADRLIRLARDNHYNIGTNHSDYQTMLNFILLMPGSGMPEEEAVPYILAAASVKGIRLPETKDKTQLEVMVEAIAETAHRENFTKKSQLWMPLLKSRIGQNEISDAASQFDGKGWKPHGQWSLSVEIGVYDDPKNREQPPFVIDFANGGHLAVCGSVVSGKSTFLQTLVFALAKKYSPDELNFYILDFSGGMLAGFESLPHTGGVVRENDTDKARKFFNMITVMIEGRKRLFNGVNYSQYKKANAAALPAIVVVIDNVSGFREKTENAYDEMLIRLSREGAGYGVFLALSAAGFGMAEIPNRIGDNIRTVVCLEMSDKFKYMDVLRTTHIDVLPESGIKGRGVGYVDGRILEFQTALAVLAEDDYKRNAAIEALGREMTAVCGGKRACAIPNIPQNPQYNDLRAAEGYAEAVGNRALLPFAYCFEDASVYSVDLAVTYCYLISGKKRTGKTNVLRLMMAAAAAKKTKGIVIEKTANELRSLSENSGFVYISDDAGILSCFRDITADFVARNKYKKSLEEQGMGDAEIFESMKSFEPIFIFIANLTEFVQSVYHPEGDIGNLSGFFENIFEKGFLHNIYFIACFNQDDASLLTGQKAYHLFISYKTGVHLGGNLSSQRLFNFRNIHYSQLSKADRKGEGLVPSAADESVAEKIIIPLYGGAT